MTYDELASRGLPENVASEALVLEHEGRPVPVHVADGGDGTFGPGDHLELVAERRTGLHGNLDEFALHDVYRLSLGSVGERFELGTAARGEPAAASRAPLERRSRLEHDELLARLSDTDVEGDPEPELWFWAKLTHLDREPFEVPLDLRGVEAEAGVEIAIRFRGLSSQRKRPEGVSDHQVDVRLDGRVLERPRWDGKLPASFDLSRGVAGGDSATLEMRVPRRRHPESGEPIVDVVLLSAVDVAYRHSGRVDGEAVALEALGAGPVGLETAGAVAYTDGGRRIELPAGPVHFELRDDEKRIWIVPEGAFEGPEGVEVDRPSAWASGTHTADLLIISHRTLIEAVRPLADFHRSSGLAVEIADVQDVFDEFNGGVVHPVAIRRFLRHAYDHWQPAPRYVLLVGDASWDVRRVMIDDASYANWTDRQLLRRNGQFAAQDVEDYADAPTGRLRNLVPTALYHGHEGHAASDNWFVLLDGDDPLPEMGIGRFPVVTPEEVEAIVAKTIRYAEAPPVGPWRRQVLWLTNEDARFQSLTDRLAAQTYELGLAGTKVYPSPDEASNEAHQKEILEKLDSGQYLVHFVGHGGRYIWRTGPPDLDKNHDLLTLDHLERLAPSERLPVVFSFTCHSGPFDHPSADSIAEKFLRLPDRGAVAVVAASWRTTPSPFFSRAMLKQIARPQRLGDAVRLAKREAKVERVLATYNLLGDPALPLALPDVVPVEVATGGTTLELLAKLEDRAAGGRALVEVLNEGGEVVWSEERRVSETDFALTADVPTGGRTVRLYFWNEAAAWDALAVASLVEAVPGGGETAVGAAGGAAPGPGD